MELKRLLLTGLALAACVTLRAQNVSDLIISEALVEADSTGIVDDFGQRGGWIELYNTSTGTVNFGGCFFTDDRADLRKSPIPKGDRRTTLGPRQVTLFYATGNASSGSFYIGFTLRPGSTLYLVSNDGRTIVDSLEIPASLAAGESVSKFPEDAKGLKFKTSDTATTPSPRVINGSHGQASNAQVMAEKDPHGTTLSLVSVTVVFTALAILWLLFWIFFERPAKGKEGYPVKPGMTDKPRAGLKGAGKASRPARPGVSPDGEVAAAIALALDLAEDGDTYAAIATALHLYCSESVHDAESFVLTIRRRPSAWQEERTAHFRKLPSQ